MSCVQFVTTFVHGAGARRSLINSGDWADRLERLGSTPRWTTNIPAGGLRRAVTVHSASPRDRLGKRGPRRSPPRGVRPGYHRSSGVVGSLRWARVSRRTCDSMHGDSPNCPRAYAYIGKQMIETGLGELPPVAGVGAANHRMPTGVSGGVRRQATTSVVTAVACYSTMAHGYRTWLER